MTLYHIGVTIGSALWPIVYAAECMAWTLMGRPDEYEFWSVK